MEHLLRLVDDLDTLRASWERAPFLSRGLDPFDDVFSIDTIQHILDSGAPVTSVRLFQGEGMVPAEHITRPRDRNARGTVRFADVAKVISSVAGGATLALEEVQSHSPAVAAFIGALATETGYFTDCTAFVTPARTRGARPHYDPTSVFLRQVYGAKRWRISAPTESWPRQPWSPDIDVDTEVVLDAVLREGECLYIPRGFVHVGEALDVASVHLSIGIGAPTWGQYLIDLLSAAAADLAPLRESPPPVFADVDRDTLFRDRLAALVEVAEKLRRPDSRPAGQPARPYRPGALRRALDIPEEQP